MDITVSLRKASQVDSTDLWNWRNDQLTRSNSITTKRISLIEHQTWFTASLIDSNIFLYIGEDPKRKEKIGVCIFSLNKERNLSKVSINLNPKMRGLGASYRLLASAISAFAVEKNIKLNLIATIRKENLASIKCFTRCHFLYDKEDSEFKYYRAHDLEIRKYFLP